MSSFMTIHLVGAGLLHVDGRTDGETEMTKPIVVFRNSVNPPISSYLEVTGAAPAVGSQLQDGL
jgi:hypothetical protein